MRILLVEDEKPLSAAIVKMLEQEHFALDPARTGWTACSAAYTMRLCWM